MTTESFNDPIDPVHAESTVFQRHIRELFQEARIRAAQWEPRPCPRRAIEPGEFMVTP